MYEKVIRQSVNDKIIIHFIVHNMKNILEVQCSPSAHLRMNTDALVRVTYGKTILSTDCSSIFSRLSVSASVLGDSNGRRTHSGSLGTYMVSLLYACEYAFVTANDCWMLFHKLCTYTAMHACECAFSALPAKRKFFHSTCTRILCADVDVFVEQLQWSNFSRTRGICVVLSRGISQEKLLLLCCHPRAFLYQGNLRVSHRVVPFGRDLGKCKMWFQQDRNKASQSRSTVAILRFHEQISEERKNLAKLRFRGQTGDLLIIGRKQEFKPCAIITYATPKNCCIALVCVSKMKLKGVRSICAKFLRMFKAIFGWILNRKLKIWRAVFVGIHTLVTHGALDKCTEKRSNLTFQFWFIQRIPGCFLGLLLHKEWSRHLGCV